MTKHINEENIRVAAYYIWEQAGRPEGQEKECWIKACEQLFACNNKKAPATRCCAKKTSAKVDAKPAAKKTSAKPAVKAKKTSNKVSALPLSNMPSTATSMRNNTASNNTNNKKLFG